MPLSEWFIHVERVRNPHVRLHDLSGQVRLEIGYGLQQRHEQGYRHTAPRVVTKALTWIRAAGVHSKPQVFHAPGSTLNRDLVGAISALQQRNPVPDRTSRTAASAESLQARLTAANERNKQLRQQLTQLTEQLETAYGEIRALRNAQPQ
jgi:hypothetical protein